MADATIASSFGSAAFGDAQERTRRRNAFLAARRHSRFVRRMRFMLPAGAVVAILVMVVVARISLPMGLDLSLAKLSVTRNAVIMDNPHLTGFDEDGREYTVRADRAIQQIAAPDMVNLETIEAQITTDSQGTATVTARSGDYDNSAGTLSLDGGIAVDSSQGYSLRLENADIDLENGTLVSTSPVSVRYQDSETTGQGLSVTGGGKSIIIEGSVRTRLMPPKRDAAESSAPALQEKTQ